MSIPRDKAQKQKLTKQYYHWKKDDSLTPEQRALKWYLYCEIELEDIRDVVATLTSILTDIKQQKEEK